MKKIITLLLVITSINCFAQPTISSSVAGEVGDEFSFTIVNTTDFDPGPAGENVTWDFSGIATSGTASNYTLITAEATGQAGTFPGANTASDYGSDTYAFFKISPSEYSIYGVYTPVTVISYSDPEEIVVFPLTYGTTNEDDLYSEFFSGIETIRSGSNELLGDGYGTLILPSGTYTNVLRMKLQEDYSDEGVDFPITIEYNFESYYWFKEGVKGPLFQYNYQEVVSGIPTVNESYQINNNMEEVAIQSNLTSSDVKLFPNPASEVLNLYASNGIQLHKAEIVDIAGRLVFAENLSGQNNVLNIQDLLAGVYIIKLTSSAGVLVESITIQ